MSGDGNPCALVLLAAGAEEMEVVITVDVLRRGGVDVVVAGLAGEEPVVCSRGVTLVPDRGLTTEDLDRVWGAVVLPGGLGGANALAEDPRVGQLLRAQVQSGRTVAAICAAPIALVKHGVLKGQTVTSHPSVRDVVEPHGEYVDGNVAVDLGLVTSRGPGTTFEFALELVGQLRDVAIADALRAPMML